MGEEVFLATACNVNGGTILVRSVLDFSCVLPVWLSDVILTENLELVALLWPF